MIFEQKNVLYKFNKESAGLYDVCEWFIANYPKDVFVGSGEDKGVKIIARIVKDCELIIKMRLTK